MGSRYYNRRKESGGIYDIFSEENGSIFNSVNDRLFAVLNVLGELSNYRSIVY